MFRKLLVPLDRSPLAEQAVGQAVALAKRSNAGIDLVLVHEPAPIDGMTDDEWYGRQWKEELAYLESIASEIETGSNVVATFAAPEGDVVDEICRRAVEVDADLVVITSHGRTGLSRAWLGSVADGIMRHAKMPVLMLRPVEGKTGMRLAHGVFKHLLITLDGSSLSEEILSPALALAKAESARVTLLRVISPVPIVLTDVGLVTSYSSEIPDTEATQALVNEAKSHLRILAQKVAAQDLEVDAHVMVSSHVATSIIDFSVTHGVDLVALSTHGRGASRFVMGSIADKVIRASRLPVLLQRPVGVRNVERLAADQTNAAEAPAFAHF